jgi:hypothetical protein
VFVSASTSSRSPQASLTTPGFEEGIVQLAKAAFLGHPQAPENPSQVEAWGTDRGSTPTAFREGSEL